MSSGSGSSSSRRRLFYSRWRWDVSYYTRSLWGWTGPSPWINSQLHSTRFICRLMIFMMSGIPKQSRSRVEERTAHTCASGSVSASTRPLHMSRWPSLRGFPIQIRDISCFASATVAEEGRVTVKEMEYWGRSTWRRRDMGKSRKCAIRGIREAGVGDTVSLR